MAMTTMSIRVDERDKKRFDLFCDQTGMNASVAVNMLAKKAQQEQRLPFAVAIDPFYSEPNRAELRGRIADGPEHGHTHELIEAGDDEKLAQQSGLSRKRYTYQHFLSIPRGLNGQAIRVYAWLKKRRGLVA
jgi:DNA-damage-inducible protein J